MKVLSPGKQMQRTATLLLQNDSYLGSYSSVINRTEEWYLFNWEDCKSCRKKEHCDPSCEYSRLMFAIDLVDESVGNQIFCALLEKG
jgi:radical SAM protein with 4Fe4S-binding SPASM domain